MAGSYNHCRGKGGKYTFEMIENLGDADEACHMMYWMIDHLAEGDRARIRRAEKAYFEARRRGEAKWPGDENFL